MQKFFAFVVHRYGNETQIKEFHDQQDLLSFVKEAKDPEGSYVLLKAVYGEEIEFEPATYVESYRIKEAP